ncbi:EndoU domain-containing protein [Ehrlichia sp. JZT12]
MKFYKYMFFCFLLLPFHLMALQSTINIPSECVNPSGIHPFFKTDQYDKCNDLPVAPTLNEFDEAVLDVCGDWGSNPKMEDFKKLLNKKEYRKYVDELYEGLNHQVFTPNADLTTFKNELAELWFSRNGFTHVMCGEPRLGKLGGMHFFGRYLQAQQNEWAGRYYNSRLVDEISDRVFTIGVKFKNTNGNLTVDARKGYDLLHANEIILHATKAYKGFAERSGLQARRTRHCLYDSEGITYVFVARKGGVVTFFADLTPHCGRGEKECSCVRLEK